jgi:uncharacterized protein (TIGR03067 family)
MEGVMRLYLLLIPVAGLLLAADDKPPKGLEPFQGSWALASLVVNGKEMDKTELKNTTLSLKGEGYTFAKGTTTNKGTYKVDPTRKPMTLDIIVTDGPDKGKTLPAIYEINGDTMRICLSIKGKDRPTAFESKPDSGTVLETWKKTK